MFDGLLIPSLRPTSAAQWTLDRHDPLNVKRLGLWPLTDGPNRAANLVVPSRPATRVGTPDVALGRTGRAQRFNGSSQYFSDPSFQFPAASGITVSFFANVTGSSTSSSGFGIGSVSEGAGSRCHAHLPYGDDLYWDYGDTSGGRINTNISAYYGKLTHFALVNNGVNFKGIYINGDLITSGTSVASPLAAMVGVDIGHWYDRVYVANFYFPGVLSWFSIHSRACNAGEIKRMAKVPSAGAFDPAELLFVAFKAPSTSRIATIAGTVDVTASVEADLALAATLSGTVAVTASLETDVALAATIGGTVGVTGALAAATTLAAVIDGTVDITASLSAGGERDAVIAGTVDITALIRATTGQGAVGGDDAPARREDVAKLSRRQRRLEREADERAARLRATLERAYRAATGGDEPATEAALAEAAEIAPPAVAAQIAEISVNDGIAQTLAGIGDAIAAIQHKKNVIFRDDDDLAMILSVF